MMMDINVVVVDDDDDTNDVDNESDFSNSTNNTFWIKY